MNTAHDFNVPIHRITEEERDRYLSEGYNRPEKGFDKNAFSCEWLDVHDKLKAALTSKWRHGCSDTDEFFVNSDWVPDRFLCAELSNPDMLSRETLAAVHAVVVSHPVPYAIDLCNAWGYMYDVEGELYPDFNIIIEKERILVYTAADELLYRLAI